MYRITQERIETRPPVKGAHERSTEVDFEVKIRVLRKFRKVLCSMEDLEAKNFCHHKNSRNGFFRELTVDCERTGRNSDPSDKLSIMIGESSNDFRSDPNFFS